MTVTIRAAFGQDPLARDREATKTSFTFLVQFAGSNNANLIFPRIVYLPISCTATAMKTIPAIAAIETIKLGERR